MNYFILDIDHTIAIPGEREKYFLSEPIQIEKGEEGIMDDIVFEPTKDIVCLLIDNGFKCIVLTARHESSMEKTLEWLDKKCNITPFEYYCKPIGDMSPDVEFKEKTIDGIIKNNDKPFIIFEDRQDVVDMFKRKNLNVLQVHHRNDYRR